MKNANVNPQKGNMTVEINPAKGGQILEFEPNCHMRGKVHYGFANIPTNGGLDIYETYVTDFHLQ